MTGDTELDILRALAYGPKGGRLDAGQSRRLEELEAARRSAAPALGAAPGESPPPLEGRRARRSAATPPVAGGARAAGLAIGDLFGDEDDGRARALVRVGETDAVARAEIAPVPAPARRSRRRRLLPAVAGAVTLVAGVVGFHLGAATAVPPEPAVRGDQVVAAESRAQAEAIVFAGADEGATWDGGGVRLLGELDGGHAWWGTIDGGDRTCVVLTLDGGEHVLACDATERVRAEGIEMGYGGADVTMVSTDGTMRAQMTRTRVLAAPYSGAIVVQTSIEPAR